MAPSPDNPAQEETQAIEAVLAGDREAYTLLVQRYKGPLYRYLLRMLRRPAEAEDAAQEAFLRAYLSLASYDSTYRFSTWLFRIATNLTLNRIKAEKRLTSLEMLQESPDGALREFADQSDDCRPGPEAERQELCEVVRECVDQLPPAYRSVVALRHLLDLSYQEIADSMELPINTVRSRLHRGRERLGECLEERLPKEDLP
jgi:RNA polymerase sigma-70 factor (ECF subfamily)